MSDHSGHPQQPDPRVLGVPQQATAGGQAIPAVQVPQPAVQVPQAPQVFQSDRAWVDGYEPGNPWQARLCVETPYGTFAYPLTPNTMPELLEQMVLVAQEQQGLPVGIDDDQSSPDDGEDDGEEPQSVGARLQGGRAARMTGWAVVHDLWEREDPTARIVMGAVVVALLLLGIFLT
ncbi:hypothetical protein SAMN04487983_100742 [Streptomyces sp. yr375]|uniref:hypothetical protein n=1 Tax=Streptomyces sp. yr375 TaxID=1761906 RepID=UPI0008CE5F63|nr:hypothetical protein [Streptomyces sp. yr375]SEQ67156.1 hypothetical protein SAMN04487983_100742 [Streptomyces sp. yr375]